MKTLFAPRFAAILATSIVTGAQAQQKYEMKLAYFVGDQHAMSQWLIKWSEQLEKGSGGRLAVKRFPARRWGRRRGTTTSRAPGRPTSSWFLHGGTPGRFPLTEIINLPFMVGSAEIGTKVINDAGAAREVPRRRAQGHQGADALHAPARRTAHHEEGDPQRSTTSRACACASPRPRCATWCTRSARRRSACRRPRSSSSCRRAPSTARSWTTAASASPSSWAAPSSTRPSCTPTSPASAWG